MILLRLFAMERNRIVSQKLTNPSRMIRSHGEPLVSAGMELQTNGSLRFSLLSSACRAQCFAPIVSILEFNLELPNELSCSDVFDFDVILLFVSICVCVCPCYDLWLWTLSD